MVPLFSSVALNGFGAKSSPCTGVSFKLHFNYSCHSFQCRLDFLVCAGIPNCFITHYIFWAPRLKDLCFTETNHELGAAVFREMTGRN